MNPLLVITLVFPPSEDIVINLCGTDWSSLTTFSLLIVSLTRRSCLSRDVTPLLGCLLWKNIHVKHVICPVLVTTISPDMRALQRLMAFSDGTMLTAVSPLSSFDTLPSVCLTSVYSVTRPLSSLLEYQKGCIPHCTLSAMTHTYIHLICLISNLSLCHGHWKIYVSENSCLVGWCLSRVQ